MLWRGRMRDNRAVWQHYQQSGRPVIVLEVGNLRRGVTWRMAINGTTASATWPESLDPQRPRSLGLDLRPWRTQGGHVLIACQRGDSQQWTAKLTPDLWLQQIIDRLRQHTQRPIRVRPHPRYRQVMPSDITVSHPRAITGTYDAFDFERDLAQAWAVVNYNSGPGVQATLAGIPAFVNHDSLAAPVANLDLSAIECPQMPDRSQWLIDISHTEWTVPEFETGEPQRILAQKLH